MRESDLGEAGRLMYRTANLERKNSGLPPLTVQVRRSPPLMQHLFSQCPGLSWGAYDGQTLAGFLVSHIRDRQWHAAYLAVDPTYQGLGIGRELLRTAMTDARVQEMHIFSQCALNFNLRVVGLASRFGMFPRKDLFLMRRTGLEGWSLPPRSQTIVMDRISSVETVTELNRMDCEVRGVNRAADHCLWLAQDDCTGFVFTLNERAVGYAYFFRTGMVGPVLAARDVFMTDILVHCLHEVKEHKNDDVRFWISGKNFSGLHLLLENRFQFHESAILLTNRVFCDMRRYLPHSLVIL